MPPKRVCNLIRLTISFIFKGWKLKKTTSKQTTNKKTTNTKAAPGVQPSLETSSTTPMVDDTGATPEPVAATTFHKFSELPTEVHDIIWSYSLPESRVVEVEWHPVEIDNFKEGWIAPCYSSHAPCSLLLVNKESRQQYLKHCIQLNILPWQPGLSNSRHYCGWFHHPRYLGAAYFNAEIDILYLSTANNERDCFGPMQSIHKLVSRENLPKLRYIALDGQCILDLERNKEFGWYGGGAINTSWIELVRCFANLPNFKKFFLTFGDDIAMEENYHNRPLRGTITLHDDIIDAETMKDAIHRPLAQLACAIPPVEFRVVWRGENKMLSGMEKIRPFRSASRTSFNEVSTTNSHS